MPLYAQHGHGKSDKISTAFETGSIQGVVFGARNEKPANLVPYVREIRDTLQAQLLFDPQFYVSTLIPPNDRFLPEYPYYRPGRTAGDFVGARRLSEYARQTLDVQMGLDLDRLIAPSVLFNTFDDRWYQIALNLADASLDYHAGLKDPPPLLLTFAFSEEALDSRSEVDGFLDQVTSWDTKGFYLLIARTEVGYSQYFDKDRLSQLLYLTLVLSIINGFEVVNGYADFCGLLTRAAGATAFATGWSQALRQFHRKSFVRQTPGHRQPRLRYSSGPLFNSILLTELEQISDVGGLGLVLSNVGLDKMIADASSPEASDWNLRTSELHHWETLQSLEGKLSGDPSADFDRVVAWLKTANAIYVALKQAGVVFERYTQGQHIPEWVEGIQLFRSAVSV